jgi:hypothetical protein
MASNPLLRLALHATLHPLHGLLHLRCMAKSIHRELRSRCMQRNDATLYVAFCMYITPLRGYIQIATHETKEIFRDKRVVLAL